MAKLTIGVPVFNGEGYIERALRSLLNQTWDDFEIIISDNCSTDNTNSICKKIVAIDSRVTLITQSENIGAAKNFLLLARNCSSHFFMWAAADDEWMEDYLERCIVVLDAESESSFVSGAVVNVDPYGKVLREYDDFLEFDNPSAIERYVAYLNSKEIDGKANLIYSIYRTDFCRKLCDVPRFFQGWGSDMAFVAGALARGRYRYVQGAVLKKRVLSLSDINTSILMRQKRYEKIQYGGSFPITHFHQYLWALWATAPDLNWKIKMSGVMFKRLACLVRQEFLKKIKHGDDK